MTSHANQSSQNTNSTPVKVGMPTNKFLENLDRKTQAMRPVLHAVYFGPDSKTEVGTIFERGGGHGNLFFKFNLGLVQTDKSHVKIILFPKQNFQERTMKEFLDFLGSKLLRDDLDHRMARAIPFYRVVYYQDETPVEVGAVWLSTGTFVFEMKINFQILAALGQESVYLNLFPVAVRLKDRAKVSVV